MILYSQQSSYAYLCIACFCYHNSCTDKKNYFSRYNFTWQKNLFVMRYENNVVVLFTSSSLQFLYNFLYEKVSYFVASCFLDSLLLCSFWSTYITFYTLVTQFDSLTLTMTNELTGHEKTKDLSWLFFAFLQVYWYSLCVCVRACTCT